MGQIEKIVSFSKRGSLTGNNGTITNVQLLVTLEKFNFFENLKYLANRKNISDLYELDNFKEKKFFLIEDGKCHFFQF